MTQIHETLSREAPLLCSQCASSSPPALVQSQFMEKGEASKGVAFLLQQSEDLWSEIQRGTTPVLLLFEI